MSDYKKMYKIMFQAVTKAIYALQEAQIKCEELYIENSQDEVSREEILKIKQLSEQIKEDLAKLYSFARSFIYSSASTASIT